MKKMILAVLFLAAALLCGCTQSEHATEPVETQIPTVTVPTETIFETVPQTIPAYSISVETPCGVLYLPDSWDIPIATESILGDPMVISFWAEDVKLYELTFSENAAGAVGMVKSEDGTIYVGMRITELENEDNMLLSMQESVNSLLNQLQLSKVEPPVQEEPTEDPVDELLIDTDIGTLVFPGKWEQYLYTELVDDYALEFYCCLPDREPVLVFTVLLRSEDGDIISSITDEDGVCHTLSIWIANPEFDKTWTDAELDMVFAMQEDMNYLLNALMP